MAASKKQVKSMDIQKPGETTPDSSSRPLITKRPMLQDPMIKEPIVSNENDPEAEPKEQKSMASSAKTITPPEDMQQDTDSTKAISEISEPGVPEDEDQPAAATDSIDPDSTPASNEAAIVDAVINSSKGSNLSNEQKADEAAEKRKQTVQALIDSKKYIVPIGQVSRARHNRRALLLLIFLIIILAGYITADLNLVALPFKLPIDLIK